jgi:hypothetical protein
MNLDINERRLQALPRSQSGDWGRGKRQKEEAQPFGGASPNQWKMFG